MLSQRAGGSKHGIKTKKRLNNLAVGSGGARLDLGGLANPNHLAIWIILQWNIDGNTTTGTLQWVHRGALSGPAASQKRRFFKKLFLPQ